MKNKQDKNGWLIRPAHKEPIRFRVGGVDFKGFYRSCRDLYYTQASPYPFQHKEIQCWEYL